MRGIIYVSPFTRSLGKPRMIVSFALAADPLPPGTYLVVADGTPLSSFEVIPGSLWVQIHTNRYGRWEIYPGLKPWTPKQTLSGLGPTQYPLSDDPVHNTALCIFRDFDVTDFNGVVPKIEIIASAAATPARCPCADMDWMGHDMTAAHHPDCPTRRPAARMRDDGDREMLVPRTGGINIKVDMSHITKALADSMAKKLHKMLFDPDEQKSLKLKWAVGQLTREELDQLQIQILNEWRAARQAKVS